jgi:hypothetical protein
MANSKDPVPPVWKKGTLSYSTGSTYDTAKKMIEAAIAGEEAGTHHGDRCRGCWGEPGRLRPYG